MQLAFGEPLGGCVSHRGVSSRGELAGAAVGYRADLTEHLVGRLLVLDHFHVEELAPRVTVVGRGLVPEVSRDHLDQTQPALE